MDFNRTHPRIYQRCRRRCGDISKMIDYKFDEPRILDDIKRYIDSTYGQHYASGRIQTNEFIMSHIESADAFKLNVLKYVTRYGHKNGHNRDDIMKAIHYLIFMLCYHDRKVSEEVTKERGNMVEYDIETGLTIDEFDNHEPVSYVMTGP